MPPRRPSLLRLTARPREAGLAFLDLRRPAGKARVPLPSEQPRPPPPAPAPDRATASADPCGLLRYEAGDSVTLEWQALHPNGFATFHHGVVKGATPLPAPVSSSGLVGAPPGTHVETHSVATLLGSCTIAGFAETVSVYAMATNGWSRLSGYDSHAIQAFALAPEDA